MEERCSRHEDLAVSARSVSESVILIVGPEYSSKPYGEVSVASLPVWLCGDRRTPFQHPEQPLTWSVRNGVLTDSLLGL